MPTMKLTSRWVLERLFYVKINVSFADRWNFHKIILKEVCTDKKKRTVDFSYAATDNINELLDN